jgi:hypothetical protein
MLIAGDIGGTKSHLVAYDETGQKLSVIARKRYTTRDFSSFENLVEEFSRHAFSLSTTKSISGAGFGVPGTVVDGDCTPHTFHGVDSASPSPPVSACRANVVLMNDLRPSHAVYKNSSCTMIISIAASITRLKCRSHRRRNGLAKRCCTGTVMAIALLPSRWADGCRARSRNCLLTFLKNACRAFPGKNFFRRGFRPIHEFRT